MGGDFDLSGLGSMAGDACHCACCMVDRVSTAVETNDWLCMLHFEQCTVGDLGLVRWSLRAHSLADLPVPHEPSRVQEEPERPVNKSEADPCLSAGEA